MGTSIKHSSKFANVLYIAFFFSSLWSTSAGAMPTADDIKNLAERVKLAADTFMQQSFRLRMQYEYSGRFLTEDDKNNLHKLAKKASNSLQAIAKSQKELKQQIEEYEGDDWDAKYGSTGLWRKLRTDLYITVLSKYEIDFYLALTTEQPETNEILRRILAEIGSLDLTPLPVNSQLLKAKILTLLVQTDPNYKQLAKKEFDALRIRSDMSHSTVFRIAIERIKLLGLTEPDQLKTMAENVAKSRCGDDIELVLFLESLQRKLNLPEAFQKTVLLFPQTKDFLGSIVLSDLSCRFKQGQLTKENLQKISIFEVELAAQAAWKNRTKDHKMLLDHLANTEKFQTPLILYVTAVSFAESAPARAINLLIRASVLQQRQKSDLLEASPYKIAEQAAQLAYNLFASNSANCSVALKAFENYDIIAAEKIDEELEYLYSVVLNNCGQIEKATKLLQKIADRPTGNYRDRAKLELIVHTIRKKQYESAGQKGNLVKQFSNLIANRNACEYSGEAMELLSEIVDEIETIQIEAGQFSKMVQDCKKLAQFCYDCLDGQRRRRAGLYLVEISVFAAGKEKEKLTMVKNLLDSIAQCTDTKYVDFIRCRARLLTEQGRFEKAGRLWAKICKIRKSEAPSVNQRSWKWWRAKFYEIYCWAKCPQTEKGNLLHTIEILENTFSSIPPLWAEKLSLLKP